MLEYNLDDLIICKKCNTLHNKVILPKGAVAKCSECNNLLYRNIDESFKKAISYSITSLILFIIANMFPIISVSIGGVENILTIPHMIFTLFNEGFIVVGAIIILVLIVAPLVTIFSYLVLAILIYFKIYKSFARYIISFLVISRNWEMIDIFSVSILVALVKLLGYAEVQFGVSSIALLLFVIVDIIILKNIQPIELWTYFIRNYR